MARTRLPVLSRRARRGTDRPRPDARRRSATGTFAGTVAIPSQKIHGLPLLKVMVAGSTVTLYAREDQTMGATMAPDGASMAGDYTMPMGSAPFALKRTGAAKIDPPLTSPRIGEELEGRWTGTVDVDGISLRVVVTLADQPDGFATGRAVNLDRGNLELPIAITQKGSSVTFESRAIVSGFAGELNEDATAMTGTWTQGALALALPVRFVRAK